MIDHRMRREPNLAGDAQSLGLSFDAALECDAVIRAEGFDTVKPFQKIEVPHGAAEFAIGGAAQSDLRLARDRTLDGGVLNGAQIIIGDLAAFVARTSVFEYRSDAAGCQRGRREKADGLRITDSLPANQTAIQCNSPRG